MIDGRPRCKCRCHACVVTTGAADSEVMRAFLHAPPRLDDDMAWAEACERCSIFHTIAMSVHNEVVSLESTELENYSIYRARLNT